MSIQMTTTCLFLCALIAGSEPDQRFKMIFARLIFALLSGIILTWHYLAGWPSIIDPSAVSFDGQMVVTTVLGLLVGWTLFNPDPLKVF